METKTESEITEQFNNFLKSLTDAELDQANAIETEIAKLLKEGLSEETSFRFIRAVMQTRKVLPSATVEGVFEVAFKAGLAYVEASQIKPAREPAKQKIRRGKLAGAGI